MPKKNVVSSSKNLFNVTALLLLVFGLASCGSGGGATAGASPPPAGGSANQNEPPATAANTITEFFDAGAGKVTAVSENSLAEGAVVTISGTDNYNGTYTVEEATPQDFTVATPFQETDTGVWQPAGNIAVGCSTSGASGAINVANVPSRMEGVAPLSVFFDATATTATASARPFHDLEYRWDFGDPAGGANWNAGSGSGVNSRNSATGAVASHVFETPGTYTVAVLATDGTNTANACTQIVVQDPDTVFAGTNTVCIGADSRPEAGISGCPAGAVTVQKSDFVTSIQSYALTGKRVLFKRGDTFTAATTASINQTGPGIVGAFGTGPAPLVQMTGDTIILGLSSADTPNIKDWRIMDLEFDGMGSLASAGIVTLGGINQVLFLNMNIRDTNDGIIINEFILTYLNSNGRPGHELFDEIGIVNSTLSPIINSDGLRVFASAERLSLLGNTMGNMINDASMGSHVVRLPFVSKGVIANNTLARPGASQVAIKLHGHAWCDVASPAGTCEATNNTAPTATYGYRTNTHPIGVFAHTSGYTEQVIVSDNRIIGGDSPYLVVVGPQNANRDERIRDVIFERNWFQAANTLTQKALVIHSYETTVRNNICDMTGGSSGATCVLVTLQGPSPALPPDNIRIYNNTAFKGDASPGNDNSPILVNIDTTSTNVTVQNNIAYAPAYSSAVLVSGAGASGLVMSNNSTNAQIVSAFPGWVSSTPTTPADFRITADSYAKAAGVATVPVFSDFFQANRLAGTVGMGAVTAP